MKGMKGKIMKKLKTMKQIEYLNPDRILQVSALDGFVDNFHLKSNFVENFPFKSHGKSHFLPQSKSKQKPNSEKPEIISVEEPMKDLEQDDEELDKENIRPSISKYLVCEEEKSGFCCNELKNAENPVFETLNSTFGCKELKKENQDYEIKNSSSCKGMKSEEHTLNETENSSCSCKELRNENDSGVTSFRRPDMNSSSLFDPNLLAAFDEVVKEHKRSKETAQLETTNSKNHKYPFFQPENQNDQSMVFEDQINPLQEFDQKCPPGGSDSVIFYTTSLRGIRKTFEDCQGIRFLLESFGLIYYERDVSIHSKYRDELWEIMGERCLPPKLFIRGRYIGGAEQVLRLNEEGKLRALFRDIPIDFSEGPCNVCTGLRFMLCYNCNGSRKVFEHDNDDQQQGGVWAKCLQCNENGLVVCPLC
ncbi:hypothetical protein RDABS01_031358 [Bienertia sinuspersici]